MVSPACAQEFVAQLNKNGQRWVPILDPPIHIKPGYAAYDSGIAQDVFVKDITGHPYVGQVESVLHTVLLHIVKAACSAGQKALPRYAGKAVTSKSHVHRFAFSATFAACFSAVLLLYQLPASLHKWRDNFKLLGTYRAPCFACLARGRMLSSKIGFGNGLQIVSKDMCALRSCGREPPTGQTS